MFQASRPSGGRAIVAREVVQPRSLDKAGDLMLFYCALCATESRNGGGAARASRGMMCSLRMCLRTLMTITSISGVSIILVILILLNMKKSLVEGSWGKIACAY